MGSDQQRTAKSWLSNFSWDFTKPQPRFSTYPLPKIKRALFTVVPPSTRSEPLEIFTWLKTKISKLPSSALKRANLFPVTTSQMTKKSFSFLVCENGFFWKCFLHLKLGQKPRKSLDSIWSSEALALNSPWKCALRSTIRSRTKRISSKLWKRFMHWRSCIET